MTTTTITTGEYERSQRHGYAGPLSDLQDSTRRLYEQAGADHWQIVATHKGAALRPVRVVDPSWRVFDSRDYVGGSK